MTTIDVTPDEALEIVCALAIAGESLHKDKIDWEIIDGFIKKLDKVWG